MTYPSTSGTYRPTPRVSLVLGIRASTSSALNPRRVAMSGASEVRALRCREAVRRNAKSRLRPGRR